MRRPVPFALAAALALALPAAAPAQLVYEFATDGPTPVFTNAFTVTVGQQVGIGVYIRDTSAGAAVFNANDGLGGAAVRLTTANPVGIARVVLPADIAFNPQFAFPGNPEASATSAAITVGAFLSGVLPDANGRVLIATFRVTGQSAGTVTLGAEDRNPTLDGDIGSFSNNINYDNLLGAGPFSASLTVVPVPEPALLLGVAALGLAGVGAVRRRRARVTA